MPELAPVTRATWARRFFSPHRFTNHRGNPHNHEYRPFAPHLTLMEELKAATQPAHRRLENRAVLFGFRRLPVAAGILRRSTPGPGRSFMAFWSRRSRAAPTRGSAPSGIVRCANFLCSRTTCGFLNGAPSRTSERRGVAGHALPLRAGAYQPGGGDPCAGPAHRNLQCKTTLNSREQEADKSCRNKNPLRGRRGCPTHGTRICW